MASIPESSLYATTRSYDYSNHQLEFVNPTDRTQSIDLSNYYLRSTRTDVQRIGLAGRPLTSKPDLLRALERVLFGSMARVGVGFIPLVGDAADMYELLTGKDFISGEKLSWGDRMLSGLGLIVGSGAGFRIAERAIWTPAEYVHQFEEGFRRVAGKSLELGSTETRNAERVVEQVREAQNAIHKSPTLKKLTDHSNFQKTDFVARADGSIIPAKGYRYVASDSPSVKGLLENGHVSAAKGDIYISFDRFTSSQSAKSALQIPGDAAYRVEFKTQKIADELRIPRGNYGKADWLEPITKDFPEFGVGGATQAVSSKGFDVERVVDMRSGKVVYDRGTR